MGSDDHTSKRNGCIAYSEQFLLDDICGINHNTFALLPNPKHPQLENYDLRVNDDWQLANKATIHSIHSC